MSPKTGILWNCLNLTACSLRCHATGNCKGTAPPSGYKMAAKQRTKFDRLLQSTRSQVLKWKTIREKLKSRLLSIKSLLEQKASIDGALARQDSLCEDFLDLPSRTASKVRESMESVLFN